MKPIILAGKAALSDFRIQAFLDEAHEENLPLGGVEATFTYFIETETGALDEAIREKTFALLAATGPHAAQPGGFFVTPRKGTISPWSSKATDISTTVASKPSAASSAESTTACPVRTGPSSRSTRRNRSFTFSTTA
jgi:hypothetical protein